MENLKLGYRDRRAGLRTDTDGFSTGAIVAVMVGGFLAILVGMILVPSLTNQLYLLQKNVTTAGNATRTGITGATALLTLPGILFILALVVIPVILALYVLKSAD